MWDWISSGIDKATEFVTKNEKLLGLAVTGASAYYAYEQQQDAIEASEQAQNRSLALQKEAQDREKAMLKLQAPTNNAGQLSLFNQNKGMSLSDFLYEPAKVSDRSSAGINTADVKNSLGLV